ncbi:MAG: bifunctional phosphoribosyl-AMP cyclohydrolase/phosphoribosyl-ATP diphosphatase HisIE [Clostridia bacterium]|nr:bifunctional phosphoribosyl-AMP cyclohydrolase/phosphoribosyl-ATP diphosphatase HisIE [Clostridia bacterium]
MSLEKLKFDEHGLIPAVVQDHYTKEVLTVAYMNRESLAITMKEGRTCFYSRSRRELWRKGETSGNVQHVVRITADCDYDALVVEVIKDGPACHTGAESCFNSVIFGEQARRKFNSDFELQDLYELLEARKEELPEGSYTSYLFAKGKEKILKKVGEECTEVIIGAMKDSKREVIFEIADLTYHILVLMVEMGVSLRDIMFELDSRHVIDKKVKQETLQ